MNLQETLDSSQAITNDNPTLAELKQALDIRLNFDVLTQHTVELEAALTKFTDDLVRFQTLVTGMISESKRQNTEMIEKNSEMLNEKISSLLTSNQQLEHSISGEVRGFAEEMTSLVDSQKKRFEKMAQDMAAASGKYASKVQADMKKAHREHTHYIRSLDSTNVARTIYLAITPAIILLDFLSRSFGWF